MTLDQLSAAATQGEWKATERSGYREILAPDDGCDWYGVPKHHAVVYIDTELDDAVQDANAAFICQLVNLYRTGQLVAVADDATVELACKAACIACGDDPEREGPWETWWRESAYFTMITAAIAAMKGPKL